MLNTPHSELTPNTVEFDTLPLIKPTGFREYDARWWFGIEGSDIQPEINLAGIQLLGLGLGTLIHETQHAPKIIVGHDYRAYSANVKHALMLGLVEAGIAIHDIGLCLSPTAYFAQFELDIPCVAMVTASHNDNGWTGIKMGAGPPLTFGPKDMQRLKSIVLDMAGRPRAGGRVFRVPGLREKHIASIAKATRLSRPLRVVTACGNGAAGIFAPEALRRIGAEIIELDCVPDYNFPRYNPNPEDTIMLAAMAEAVTKHKAAIGLGFDGDGDRCGVVDETGTPIFADKIGLMLARDLAARHKNAHFVVDVKSTGLYATDPILQKHGASLEYYMTGHSHMKRRVHETGALAGFEKSGHFFFAGPLGHGYDDGLVAAREILAMLDRNPDTPVSALCAALGQAFTSITMSAHCPDEQKYAVCEAVAAQYEKMASDNAKLLDRCIRDINRINGIRVTLEDGSWLLVRASSNKPELVIVVESTHSDADMRRLFHEGVKPELAAHANVGAYNQQV